MSETFSIQKSDWGITSIQVVDSKILVIGTTNPNKVHGLLLALTLQDSVAEKKRGYDYDVEKNLEKGQVLTTGKINVVLEILEGIKAISNDEITKIRENDTVKELLLPDKMNDSSHSSSVEEDVDSSNEEQRFSR